MVFSSISAKFFSQYIAEITNLKYIKWTHLLRPENKNCKVFMLGLYFPKNPFWKKIKCKKMLIVFSGSDIISLKKIAKLKRNKIISSLEKRGYTFASNGKFLKDEVDDMYKFKRSVDIVRLPSRYKFNELNDMPKNFSVSVYMPQVKKEFYGYSTIIKVVKQMKDVDFIFYSGKGYNPSKHELKLKNFKYIKNPIDDMPTFLNNVSCGLRVTEHDASCMTAIEHNMAGRWFVFNHEMEHCVKLSYKPSVEEIIRSLIKLKEKKDIVNKEGLSFYREKHSVSNFLKNTRMLLN